MPIKLFSIRGMFQTLCFCSVIRIHYWALISVVGLTATGYLTKYDVNECLLPYELYTSLFLFFVNWLLARNADSPRFPYQSEETRTEIVDCGNKKKKQWQPKRRPIINGAWSVQRIQCQGLFEKNQAVGN